MSDQSIQIPLTYVTSTTDIQEYKHMSNFVTEDSGQREQFASGMVRDVQTGKPRFDLVFDGPVLKAALINLRPDLTGVIEEFFDWYWFGGVENGAVAVNEISAVEGGPLAYFSRCALLMERGAVKYAEKNWMLANGESEFRRAKISACRHFIQYVWGEPTEDHAAAVWFNINLAEYTAARIRTNTGTAA